MSIILSDEQCLQWIKDPSISPYVKKYWYTIEGDKRFFDRISKKQILTNEMNWNPNIFINRVKDICFINSLLRQKIVDKINEYEDEKIRDDLVWPHMLLTLSLVVTQVAHLARGHPEQQ
jgi:hypothetical protein